jgi:heme exporter protein B
MHSALQGVLAVAEKDARSELRTRVGLTSVVLFIVTTVSVIVFALADEPVPRPLAVTLLWVVMFYTAMSGLGRAFVGEQDRGTAFYLRLHTLPLAVYFGKLAVNLLMALLSNLAALVLMLFFVPSIAVGSISTLLVAVGVGSVGLAAVLTIVSAIVAQTGTRNPLLPVLSFPLLVPVILPGVKATLYALAGMGLSEAASDLMLMAAYSGIVIVVSTFVFDVVWAD